MTPVEQITSLYIGYFGRAPDPEGLNYWVGRLADGFSLAEIAESFSVQPESTAKYPYLANQNIASPQAFITQVYLNLFNRVPDAEGLAYWTAELEAGADVGDFILNVISGAVTDPDQTIIENKIEVGADFALDAANTAGFVYNNAAAAAAVEVIDGVDATDASVDAAKAETDAFLNGSAGGAPIVLTTGVDLLTATGANELIVGTISEDGNGDANGTLSNGDEVSGGAGEDTLRIIASSEQGEDAVFVTNGIETIEVRNFSGTDLDLIGSGFNGVDEFVASGNDSIYIGTNNSGEEVQEEFSTVTFRNFTDNDDLDIEVANDVFAGDDDTLIVNLENAGSIEDSDYVDLYLENADGDDVIENYVVNSISGAGNYVWLDDAEVTKTLTINGSADVEVELSDEDALESIDASGTTGDVIISETIDVENDFTYTGAQGADDVRFDESTVGVALTVNSGAGDDRVQLDTDFAASSEATLVGGAGRDTLAISAASIADLLTLDATGFEVLALTDSAAGPVTIDADDIGFDEITLEADVNEDLTLEDFNGGTLNIEASQTDVIIIESNTTSDTLSVVIDAGAGVTLTEGVDVTDVETVNFSSASEDDDLTLTTINVTGVDTLSFSGEGDVDIDGVTGADDVGTIDLSALTGRFDNSGFDIGATTDLSVGNIGNTSVFDLSGTAGRNVLTFGAELDNDIRIGDFDFGVEFTSDVLDLGALGVDSLADLTFTDVGADVVITSDTFDGSITLVGVLEGNLTAQNFAF